MFATCFLSLNNVFRELSVPAETPLPPPLTQLNGITKCLHWVPSEMPCSSALRPALPPALQGDPSSSPLPRGGGLGVRSRHIQNTGGGSERGSKVPASGARSLLRLDVVKYPNEASAAGLAVLAKNTASEHSPRGDEHLSRRARARRALCLGHAGPDRGSRSLSVAVA